MNTISLCDECYADVPAMANPFPEDTVPMIYKICAVHGMKRGMLEKDKAFYNQFNTYGRRNKYPIGIINITGKCNANCKYCFHPRTQEEMPIEQIHDIIKGVYPSLNGFILSGGEPTCHSQYMEILRRLHKSGLTHSMLTNGVLLDDDAFFYEAIKNGIVDKEQKVCAQISIHGIAQQGEEVYNHQISFLEKCRKRGLKVHMAMINLDYGPDGHSIIDEVEKTTAFMQEWRDVVPNWRVRTVCNAWEAQNVTHRRFNSDLVKQFEFRALQDGKEFSLSDLGDTNNIYAICTTYDGMNLALMGAPSLDSIDLGYLDRGPFMLANDQKWYSVPHALLINEGMGKCWYRGKRIDEV